VDKNDIRKGTRLYHPRDGWGTVTSVNHHGRATIELESGRTKHNINAIEEGFVDKPRVNQRRKQDKQGNAASMPSIKIHTSGIENLNAGAEKKHNTVRPSPTTENDAKTEIRQMAKERHIPNLVHFTLRKNLRSILEKGLISRADLEASGSRFSPGAEEPRIDEYRKGVSLSVSFPNYRMFYSVKSQSKEPWAVILLDIAVLWKYDCAFFPSNSSKSEFQHTNSRQYKSSSAFDLLFSKEFDGVKRSESIGQYFTTDPQAEVVVFNKIPPLEIQSFAFERNEHIPDQQIKKSILCKHDPFYFTPRADYELWQTQNEKSGTEFMTGDDTADDLPF
jgi:hypothetical protein